MKKLKVLSIVFLMAMGFIAFSPAYLYAQDNAIIGDIKDDSKVEVAIDGFCPVCVLSGEKVKGNDHFITEYKGKIYKFVGMTQQKEFLEDPEKYATDLDAKFQQLK